MADLSALEAVFSHHCDAGFETECEQQFLAGWQLGIVFFHFDFLPQLDLVAITAEMAAGGVEQLDHLEAEGTLVLWLCSACSELCLLQTHVLPILWQWQSIGSFGHEASM